METIRTNFRLWIIIFSKFQSTKIKNTYTVSIIPIFRFTAKVSYLKAEKINIGCVEYFMFFPFLLDNFIMQIWVVLFFSDFILTFFLLLSKLYLYVNNKLIWLPMFHFFWVFCLPKNFGHTLNYMTFGWKNVKLNFFCLEKKSKKLDQKIG